MQQQCNNLKELLDYSVAKFAQRNAFVVRDEKGHFKGITYRQFNEQVSALGTALHSIGLGTAHIGIIGENRLEWALSFYAVMCGLGVACTLDKELSKDELINLTGKGDISAVIYSKSAKEKIDALKEAKPDITLICMDEGEGLTVPSLLSKGYKMIAEGNREYLDFKPESKNFSLLLFTSGTTGSAKGVMLSQFGLCNLLEGVRELNLPVPKPARFLSVLPVHHIYECYTGLIWSISIGATVYFSRGIRYLPEELKEVKPTVIVGVPLLFESFYKKVMFKINKTEGAKEKLEKGIKIAKILKKVGIEIRKKIFAPIYEAFGGEIGLLICGAAAIKPEVAKFYNDIGIYLIKGYGLTETSPLLTGELYKKLDPKTQGTPISTIELKIVDPDEDGNGEIVAKGASVMLGYYKEEQATREVIKDGWFHTGDLGYLKDGYLYITGRKKNMIVLPTGKKVFPEELEEELLQFSFIKECIVHGAKTSGTNEVVIRAIIIPDFDVLKDEFGTQKEEVDKIYDMVKEAVTKANQKFVFYKQIAEFIIREVEFEKTTTKKIKRYKEIAK